MRNIYDFHVENNNLGENDNMTKLYASLTLKIPLSVLNK